MEPYPYRWANPRERERGGNLVATGGTRSGAIWTPDLATSLFETPLFNEGSLFRTV